MSTPEDTLVRITHKLHTAVSTHDRGQVLQLLPSLQQSLAAFSQQRHLHVNQGLQLLQLAAEALTLSSGNLQV